jgi:hypothetical protein
LSGKNRAFWLDKWTAKCLALMLALCPPFSPLFVLCSIYVRQAVALSFKLFFHFNIATHCCARFNLTLSYIYRRPAVIFIFCHRRRAAALIIVL